MKKTNSLYHGPRFPASITSHAVRRYLRSQFSLRDIKERLLGTAVRARRHCQSRINPALVQQIRHRLRALDQGYAPQACSTWHLDEGLCNCVAGLTSYRAQSNGTVSNPTSCCRSGATGLPRNASSNGY